MSEHISVTGEVDFQHLPMDEEGGFAFCHYCNKVKNKLTIEIHQGIVHDYIQCICPKCKKTIWVAELTNSYNDPDLKKGDEGYDEFMKIPNKYKTIGDDGRVIIHDNKKCHVCKKPTNHYDCEMIRFGDKRDKYFCSEKCCNKFEKEEMKRYEAKEKQRAQKEAKNE